MVTYDNLKLATAFHHHNNTGGLFQYLACALLSSFNLKRNRVAQCIRLTMLSAPPTPATIVLANSVITCLYRFAAKLKKKPEKNGLT